MVDILKKVPVYVYLHFCLLNIVTSSECIQCGYMQTLLDADVKPLSPTEEHLMEYSTNQHLQTETNTTNTLCEKQYEQSFPHTRPILVPTYSLPGAAMEEISFEAWKKQQQHQRQHHIIPATQQVQATVPSPLFPVTSCPERDCQTHGTSSPTGYCETNSDVYAEGVATGDERLDPRVQQAWGSETQLLGAERPRSRDRTPSLAEVKITKKKDQIISDW